ncbi:MAG: hypothetical protein KGO81_10820 [Bacteroidota bacterium]|nr:hypothetical protein [Bacteroidota bacterium]
MLDETKVQESTNADGNSVSQPIAKPNVIGSQSQQKFTAIDLLNTVCDALLAYRCIGEKPYSIVINFEFPNNTYEKFTDEFKTIAPKIFDALDIEYGSFKFSVSNGSQ